jgi:hypothetical protein
MKVVVTKVERVVFLGVALLMVLMVLVVLVVLMGVVVLAVVDGGILEEALELVAVIPAQ